MMVSLSGEFERTAPQGCSLPSFASYSSGRNPAAIIDEANHLFFFLFEVQAAAHKYVVRVLSKAQDVEHAAVVFDLAQLMVVTLDGVKTLAVVKTSLAMVTTLDHLTELAVVPAPLTLPSKYPMETSRSKNDSLKSVMNTIRKWSINTCMKVHTWQSLFFLSSKNQNQWIHILFLSCPADLTS
jgi:hypothetical protein